MPASPGAYGARYVDPIRGIYADAEIAIIGRIAQRLKKGIKQEGWAANKLAELSLARRDIEAEVSKLDSLSAEIRQSVGAAYRDGTEEAVYDMQSLDLPVAVQESTVPYIASGSMDGDDANIEAIADSAIDAASSTHLRVRRVSEDLYRDAVRTASGSEPADTFARIKAAQRTLNKSANDGIAGYVDRKGRSWNLVNYIGTAVSSALGQAALDGYLQTLEENNVDLVKVSNHNCDCPLCTEWEGKVLSISGRDFNYQSLTDAMADGLFHTRCKHFLVPYSSKPIPDNLVREGRAQYRSEERMISKWKKRQAAAITDEDRALADAKVQEWEKKLQENKRTTWKQSEEDIGKKFPDHEPQVSFKNGQRVPYGTKGSVRTDLYKNGSAIEVKNYDLSTRSARKRLVNVIAEQVGKRYNELPSGTEQQFDLDVRGQEAGEDVLKEIQGGAAGKVGRIVDIRLTR